MDSELRSVKIHDKDAFVAMRKAGQLAAETLDFIYEYVQPGVTTDRLDKLCADFIIKNGAGSLE